jgi:hypothetical protein
MLARRLLLREREAGPPLPYVCASQLGHPHVADADLCQRASPGRPLRLMLRLLLIQSFG